MDQLDSSPYQDQQNNPQYNQQNNPQYNQQNNPQYNQQNTQPYNRQNTQPYNQQNTQPYNQQNNQPYNQQNTQPYNQQNHQQNPQQNKQESTDSSWSLITYGLVIVFIIVILYYSYCKFVSNTEADEPPEPDKKPDTSGNIVAGYDVETSINAIEDQQQRIIKTLSKNANLKSSEIIINDVPTKNNRDLTEFLTKNIDAIVTRGYMRIKFAIAKPHTMSTFRSRGITKFPVLLDDFNTCVGVPSIVEEIRKRVRTNKKPAPPKNEEEVLGDFMQAEAFSGVGKDADGKFIAPKDSDDDPGAELESQFLKEQNRRKKGAKGVYDDQTPTKKAPKNRAHDLEVKGPNRDQSEDVRATFRDRGARPDNVGSGEDLDDSMQRQMLEKLGAD